MRDQNWPRNCNPGVKQLIQCRYKSLRVLPQNTLTPRDEKSIGIQRSFSAHNNDLVTKVPRCWHPLPFPPPRRPSHLSPTYLTQQHLRSEEFSQTIRSHQCFSAAMKPHVWASTIDRPAKALKVCTHIHWLVDGYLIKPGRQTGRQASSVGASVWERRARGFEGVTLPYENTQFNNLPYLNNIYMER